MIKFTGLLTILIVLVLSGCVEDNTPENMLRDYVNYRFSKKAQSKSYLLKKTTGEMHKKIKGMNDEEFNKFAVLRNYKKRNLKILSKRVDGDKCFITYYIKYDTFKMGQKVFTSEIKKSAKLIKLDNAWKVSNVFNIKTYHDSKNPIDPLK